MFSYIKLRLSFPLNEQNVLQRKLQLLFKKIVIYPFRKSQRIFRKQKIKNVTDFGNQIFTTHDFEVAMLS